MKRKDKAALYQLVLQKSHLDFILGETIDLYVREKNQSTPLDNSMALHILDKFQYCYQEARNLCNRFGFDNDICVQVYLETIFNVGALLQHDLKDYEKALELYDEVNTLTKHKQIKQCNEGTYKNIMINYTNCVHNMLKLKQDDILTGKDLDEAIKRITDINQLNEDATNYHNLGFLQYQKYMETKAGNGLLDNVKRNYLKAYKMGHIDSIFNLGNVCRDLGDYDMALAYYKKIITKKDHEIALSRDINLYVKTMVETATILTKLMVNMETYESTRKKFDCKTPDEIFQSLLECRITDTSLYSIIIVNYGFYLSFFEGDAYKANMLYHNTLSRYDNKEIISNYLLNSLYYTDNLYELLSLHRKLVSSYITNNSIKPCGAVLPDLVKSTDRTIKIGIVSGDLYKHACSFFLDAIFRYHDRDKYEIHLFSTSPHWPLDAFNDYVSQVSQIYNMNPNKIVKIMLDAHLDVVIDCSGHTSNNIILEVLSRRVAPKQINFLGYPFFTGLDTMDYRISQKDTEVLPDKPLGCMHSERLMFLPGSFFLSYTPSDQCIIPQSRPSIQYKKDTNGLIRIGIVNKAQKWNHQEYKKFVYKLIDSIKVAGIEKFKIYLRNKSQGMHLFEKRYLPYIQVVQPYKTYYEHMDAFNSLDFLVDTFPYNATTILFESMLMGVSMYTLANGQCHHSRVGQSIISHFWPKMKDRLIGETPDKLIEKIINDIKTHIPNESNQQRIDRSKEFMDKVDPKTYTKEFMDLVGTGI